MSDRTLVRTLRFDVAANALAAVVLLVAGGWLAGPFGLAAGWPLRLVGLALGVNAVENLIVARRVTPGGLMGLAAVDLLFAAAVLVVAVADPTAAATWVRWLLAIAAVFSAIIGMVKLAGLRSQRAAVATIE